MTAPPASDITEQLSTLDAASPLFATDFVDRLLAAAREGGASDVHLHPTPAGLEVRWRIDGVLQRVGEFPRGKAADVVTRLKVLAQLLTYRADVPQEGRIQPGETTSAGTSASKDVVEMRVSTFPTLHGERAVVRLFAGDSRFLHLQDLGFPEEIEAALARLLNETSGAIVISGPAGSGKTTTAYASLREIVRSTEGRRSIVSLEDPIESALPGVSQSQVATNAGFDLATGLRSLMRQDPEVILVGEIRDAVTAETVFQAALTGHLVLSTFHAGGAAAGISRLVDMGIEPYLLRSGVRAMLHQRLVRRLCACNRPAKDAGELLGLPVDRARVAAGCSECRQTGYRGRLVLAEALPPLEGELGSAVLDRRDALELAYLAKQAGMTTIFERACAVVESGAADPAEVRRVLGFSDVGGRAAC